MIREEYCDLFTKSDEYWLAHCISADFAMGKGIAVKFNEYFNMKARLKSEYPFFWDKNGYCLISDGTKVFNLVTKEKYWYKPTYETIRQALIAMREQARLYKVDKIAMPLIGCGLDKLRWEKVRTIIEEVFATENVEILVCLNERR